jgi:hypothetical protein
MDETTVALVGAILGIVAAVVGIIVSVRASARARAVNDAVMAYHELTMASRELEMSERRLRVLLDRAELSPEQRARMEDALRQASDLQDELRRVLAEIEAAGVLDEERDSAGSPRTGDQTRTVEVESQDGSRTALGIDPSDADSVERFVDDARRIRAERVLAVR